MKTLHFFFCTSKALSAAATVANLKIRYDAKTPQFAIFGTRVICVFYSITMKMMMMMIMMMMLLFDDDKEDG